MSQTPLENLPDPVKPDALSGVPAGSSRAAGPDDSKPSVRFTSASAMVPIQTQNSGFGRLGWGFSLQGLGLMAGLVMLVSSLYWLIAGNLPVFVVIGAVIAIVAGVLVLGATIFAPRTDVREGAAEKGFGGQLLEALNEPAAIIANDGRILATNAAWTAAGGHARRMPSDEQAPGLYMAMLEAAQSGEGRAQIRLGNADMEAVLARLGEHQVLMRASTARLLGAGLVKGDEVAPEQAAPVVSPSERAAGFDEFVLAAPFGQALLRGHGLFESRIITCNPAFARLFDLNQVKLVGADFGGLIEDQAREEAQTRLKDNHPGPFEIRVNANKDKPIHMLVTAARPDEAGERAFMVYLFDISEQKQLEQSLAQVQKMQAIGQFAGGVAHDLNNLLTGIKLRVEELLHNHPLGDPSYDGLNEIRQISTRSEDLVKKLLAFSRKQTVKRVTLNLGELISEFEVLLRRLMREDVKLETEYGRDLPNIHADKGQMEMAVMNLVVNARDALASSGGGHVKIRTAALSQGQAVEAGWAACPEQGAALIEVSDTGPGITPEVMTKVFEPFFTTKPLGEGTGLGLATVYGIVNQADGHIALSSIVAPAQGHGATFRIFLPIRIDQPRAPGAEVEAPAAPPKVTPKDISGTGKILFVEDEEIVRGIAARLLRQRGYEVIEAADGEEALEIIVAENGKFDLLISDVIMPGLDGPSMLKKARPILGNVPVMFISGYAESDFSDLLEDEEGINFLPKPLDIKTLAEKVKERLTAG
jgi:two-component system, cell cycle sensor histidine kinase and response regulator CckA